MYKQCIDESLKRDISNALRRYFEESYEHILKPYRYSAKYP